MKTELPDLIGKSQEEIQLLFDDPETGPSLKRALARYLVTLKDPNAVISAFSSYVE